LSERQTRTQRTYCSTWRITNWATVCKTVRAMISDRCLSVLSVLSVRPVCDVGVLWRNDCMDQDETWHAGRPRPWPHCVRWGPSSPSSKGAQPPIFGPYLLWPNGWMHQDVTRYGGRPRPKRQLWILGTQLPSPKRGQRPLNFRPMSIVAKRLDGSMWHLAWR